MAMAKDFKLEELNEDVVRSVSRYATSSLCPLSAFFGGIVA